MSHLTSHKTSLPAARVRDGNGGRSNYGLSASKPHPTSWLRNKLAYSRRKERLDRRSSICIPNESQIRLHDAYTE